MNIFFSDESPDIAARNLDFKRVNKMLLESCQMLSTAINELGGKAPYKSTHKNHPSNVWVRESKANYEWLLSHAQHLNNFYTLGSSKTHGCQKVLLELISLRNSVNWTNHYLTEFPNCAANDSKGINFKHIQDPIEAYRRYLIARWNTDKLPPDWRHCLLKTSKKPFHSWLRIDNNGKYFYKGKEYEVLFNENTNPIS